MFGKSKYKRITSAVFPEKEGGGIVNHEVGNLLHYAATTPSKLPKIGKWLEKRGKLELERRHLGQVGVVMDAFNKLIDACHDHLTMFAINCLNMIEACFVDQAPEAKIMAKETFVRFVSVENVGGEFQVANQVTHLINMADTPLEEPFCFELRAAGLSGLQVFIAVADDIDSVIRRYASPQSQISLIRSVLGNLHIAFKKDPDLRLDEEEEGEEGGDQVDGEGGDYEKQMGWAAAKCLSNLGNRVNNITVRTLIASLLEFIDSRNLWAPRTFALLVIRMSLESIQSQHHYIVVSALLHHIESSPEPLIKTNMVYVISSISQSSSSGMVDECMNLIVKNLKDTLDFQGKQEEEVLQLRKALINCMTVVVESSPDLAQKGEAFEYIVDCIKKESDSTKIKLLLRALRPQLLHIVSLALSKDYPLPVIEVMISLASSSDRSIRLAVQKLLHLVLIHENAPNLLGSPHKESSGVNQLRASLFKQIRIRTNEPENISIIVKNLLSLLNLYKETEVSLALPRVFGLQDAANECDGGPLSRSIHTAIGSYLFSIAKLFNIRPLQEYVVQIMEKRKKENQACRYLKMQKDGQLTGRKRYKEEKDSPLVTIFFEREKVTPILCSVQELQGQEAILDRVLPTEKIPIAKIKKDEVEAGDDENKNWSVVLSPPTEVSLSLTSGDLMRAVDLLKPKAIPKHQFNSFQETLSTLSQEKEEIVQKQKDLFSFLNDFDRLEGPLLSSSEEEKAKREKRKGKEEEGEEEKKNEETNMVVFSNQCTLGLSFPAFCEVW